jgi:hypothetical protein
MKNLPGFQAFGTAKGDDQSIRLDEITLVADPETIRALGIFLINAAYEMEENEVEHIHLQDVIENFSYDDHVDLIPHLPGQPSGQAEN